MQQQGTDADKVNVLKAGVKDKGITIDQLLTLLNQFHTDDSKIEAAKVCFPYYQLKSFLRICDIFSREEYKDASEISTGSINRMKLLSSFIFIPASAKISLSP